MRNKSFSARLLSVLNAVFALFWIFFAARASMTISRYQSIPDIQIKIQTGLLAALFIIACLALARPKAASGKLYFAEFAVIISSLALLCLPLFDLSDKFTFF